MSKRKKIFLSFLFSLLLGLSFLFYFQRDSIRQSISSKLLETLEKKTGYRFTYSSIDWNYPLTFHINNLDIYSENILIGSIEDAEAQVSTFALLNREILVRSLKIENLHIYSFPENSFSSSSNKEIQTPIQIEAFQINKLLIDLPENHFAYPLFPLSISGNFSLDKKIESVIKIGKDSLNLSSHILLELKQYSENRWHSTVSFIEPANGLIGKLIPAFNPYGFHGYTTIDFKDSETIGQLHLNYLCCDSSNSAAHFDSKGSIKTNYTFSLSEGINFSNLQAKIGIYEVSGDFQYKWDQSIFSKSLWVYTHHSFSPYDDFYLDGFNSNLNIQGTLNSPKITFHLSSTKTFWKNYTFNQGQIDGQISKYENQNWKLTNLNIDFDHDIHIEGIAKYNSLEMTADLYGSVPLEYFSNELEGISNFHIIIGNQNELTMSIPKLKWSNFSFDSITSQISWNQNLLNIKTFEAKLENETIQLNTPFTFELNTDQLVHSPIDISFLSSKWLFITKNKNTHLNLSNFPLNFFESYYPSIEGTLFADIDLWSDESYLNGLSQIKIKDLNLLNGTGINLPLNADLNAALSRDGIKIEGDVNGIAEKAISLHASLPTNIQINPFKIHESTPAISAELHLTNRLESLIKSIFPSTKLNLTGDTDILINATGDLLSPKIDGKILLKNGTFELLTVGTSLQNLTGTANIEGNKIIIKELTAEERSQPTYKGKGEIFLKKGLPFDLQFTCQKAVLSPFPSAEILTNGNFTFKGDTSQAFLEGQFITDTITITFPEQKTEPVYTIGVTYVNQPDSFKETPPSFYWPISFDLDFDVPHRCFVKSRDLTSEWKGKGKLSGTTYDLSLNGSCKLISGDYKFNGLSFQLDEGLVSFNGDLDKNSSLYIIASRDLNTLKAEIIVKGSLKSPAISFRSNPPLPQREILSWILFNRGSSDISEFQGTQLNQSITNLGNGNQQKNILTKIREQLGIDCIDINCDGIDSNEVSVQVGKYISKEVFISLNKSITADATNRVAIEAKLLQNLKLQAEIDDRSEGQFQLKWKKDY